MKFSIKVGYLTTAIDKVTATVDKKGTDEGIGGILVRAVKTETASAVYFYSTMHKAETVVKVEIDVDEPGEALFATEQLKKGLVNHNPEHTAILELVERPDQPKQVCITIGKSVVHMGYDSKGMASMITFMEAIPFRQPESFTMSGKDLAELVRRAAFCIPRENEGTLRFELSALRFLSTERGYEAHATDGHVCARIISKGEQGAVIPSVLLPYEALLPLSKLVKKEETVKVIEGAKNDRGDITKLFFKIGNNTFFGTMLLAGTFPVIDTVIEMHKPDFWFTVNREALKQILERAVAFDDLRLLRINLAGSVLKLSARGNAKDTYDEIEIELEEGVPEGLNLNMTINIDYLKNVAAGSTLEKLRIGISDTTVKAKASRGLVVDDTSDKVSALYVIMPVKA